MTFLLAMGEMVWYMTVEVLCDKVAMGLPPGKAAPTRILSPSTGDGVAAAARTATEPTTTNDARRSL